MLARYLMASLLGVLLNIHVAAFSQEVASGEAKPDETPANADAGATSEAASSDPDQAAEAKAAFDEKFVAWKAAMNAINDLRIRYQTADEAGRKRIEADLQTQFKTAQAMIPAMVDAGLKAHEAAPGDDQELTDFLVEVAGFYFRSDRYEDALPLIATLQKGKASRTLVPAFGGVSAVAVGDFDAAKTYFDSAAGFLATRPSSQVEREIWTVARDFAENLAKHRNQWEHEQEVRAKEAAADDLPRVALKTSQGDIVIELFENEAPNTVKSFVSLVEKGYYDHLAFHRVLPNFMAQGGGSRVDGSDVGGPGYRIPCECYEPDTRMHFRGSLSMAHTGQRDTGGAQFFLTFRPTPHLDAKHTVFGRVIEGLEVLAKIQRRDPDKPDQPDPDEILDATVVRKRPGTKYNEFQKFAD